MWIKEVEFENLATLWRQLSWSHFKLFIPLKNELQKDFYSQMCYIEGWSVDTLGNKNKSMLFERTAISKKPDDFFKQKLHQFMIQSKKQIENMIRD